MYNIIERRSKGRDGLRLLRMRDMMLRLCISQQIACKALIEPSPGEVMLSDEQIVARMSDLVRYTVVADHDDLVATTESFVKGFRDAGFTIDELDNKYLSGESTYRGIHLSVLDADGQRFEVQVHSEKSLEVKYRNRTLYEEARKPSTSLERRLELDKEMIEIVKSLPRPKDIEKLKSF